MIIVGLHVVFLIFQFFIESGEANTGQNLLVVSKHEPATGGNLVPRTQQSLLVSRGRGTGVKRFIFPSQAHDAFLPQGLLSDPVPVRAAAPTVISPAATTSSGSGFDGITQSINNIIASVNKNSNNILNTVQTDVSKNTNTLSGLIKVAAEKQINAILANVLGGLVVNKQKAAPNVPLKTNTEPVRNNVANRRSQMNIPLVIRKEPVATTQTKFNTGTNIAPIASSTGILQNIRPTRIQANAANRNTGLQPQTDTNQALQTRALATRVQTPILQVPSASSNVGRQLTHIPSVENQLAQSARAGGAPTINTDARSRQDVSRLGSINRPNQLSVTRQFTRRQPISTNRNFQITRTQTQTRARQPTNQIQQAQPATTRRVQCPSRANCRVINPATCRRPSFTTDGNGRRVCRGCDEDRCEFGGFERRWGRGFG